MISFKVLFGPGIRLMRQLRIATKMSGMGLFLLVPLVLLLLTTYQHADADRRIATTELQGVSLVLITTKIATVPLTFVSGQSKLRTNKTATAKQLILQLD